MTGKIPQQISYYESQYQRSAHVHFHTFTVYKTLEKLNIEVHNSHDITHILHTKCSWIDIFVSTVGMSVMVTGTM